MRSFGVTLLILLLTFGALVAASVPIILALTADPRHRGRRRASPAS